MATDAMMEGVDGFLLKPFTGEELKSALAGVLQREHGPGGCVEVLVAPDR